MEKQIVIDGTSLVKICEKLSEFPKEVPKAISSVANRTIASARTQMKREVTGHYTVKSSDVLKTISVKKSTPKTLKASATASGGQVALYKFKHKPTNPPPRQRYVRPVTAQVQKAGGEKVVIHKGNKAFIQTMNGANMIFARKGKKRYPIKKLYALSIPQMISNKDGTNQSAVRIQVRTQQIFEKRVNHEIQYRLNKISAKSKKGG
ncbi:MAG: phage tail protein [Candidatus Scatosoma sp.]